MVEEIRSELMCTDFDRLWSQRNSINAEPLALSDVKSGYGLPVFVGLREVSGGYIFALFEDRRGLLGGNSLSSEEDVNGFVPFGWFILDEGENDLRCCGSSLIKEIYYGIKYQNDRYFRSIAEMARNRIHGISVTQETYLARRKRVLERLQRIGTEVDQRLASEMLTEDIHLGSRLTRKVHKGRGLGRRLMGLGLELAQKIGKPQIRMDNCYLDSQVMIESGHFNYRIVGENSKLGYKDYLVWSK